jgi:hypothetical protein
MWKCSLKHSQPGNQLTFLTSMYGQSDTIGTGIHSQMHFDYNANPELPQLHPTPIPVIDMDMTGEELLNTK